MADYLSEIVLFGGEEWTRRDVIAYLQRLGAADWVIGSYMERLPVVG